MKSLAGSPAFAGQMRRWLRDLRTEAAGPAREAVAVGIGVFIGSLPVYGLHLVLCVATGWLLRLNRLKMYVAANISNPFLAPLLLLTELQTGAVARRGELRSLTLTAVKQIDPWSFGADIVVGGVIVGAILGVTIGTATWLLTREGTDDPLFASLVRRASDRFVPISIIAWEFARGKLRGDPLYRTILSGRILPSAAGGTLVDVGCGSGLTLALLAEAAAAWRVGTWPGHRAAPPLFDRLIGIELRPRVARLAKLALGDAATIVAGDARAVTPEHCDVVLFFDVLHMIPYADQERLLVSIGPLLARDGVLLVREADAAAGRRFLAVRMGNQLKALAFGRWRQRFYFRSASEWTALFNRLAFSVSRQGAGEGTPFGNVLFIVKPAAVTAGETARVN